jgi:gluconokinase
MSSVLDEVVDAVEPAPDILSVMAAAKRAYLVSLDVGTSGVRAALFDDQGDEITRAHISNYRRNLTSFSDLGWLDADSLVEQVFETLDELMSSAANGATRIQAIAISCFWHSMLGVDADGNPTTQLLTWADTRAANAAKSLATQFDELEIHKRTGCRFHPSYWPVKLQWLKSERPAVFSNTVCWLGFSEYLCERLFGTNATSISMASATGLFDQHKCDWDWPFIKALGIPERSLPAIAIETERPKLKPELADRWPGLSDARLYTILGDGAANNIGGGCCTRDKMALMVGTSGAMRVVYDGEPFKDLPASLWSYRVDRSRVVVGGALSDGGGLYRWLTELMSINGEPGEIERRLNALEPDSHGLTILPFWSGERSTGWSPDARGAILGLTRQTSPIEILRAALEAIAYRFVLIADALDGLIGRATIFATGNALRSSHVWLQIMADVLGRKVNYGGSPEASTRGAALLALEALGKIESIEQSSVAVDEVFDPDMTRHARYREGLARQEVMYSRLLSDKL